jgi:hypothetical protein
VCVALQLVNPHRMIEVRTKSAIKMSQFLLQSRLRTWYIISILRAPFLRSVLLRIRNEAMSAHVLFLRFCSADLDETLYCCTPDTTNVGFLGFNVVWTCISPDDGGSMLLLNVGAYLQVNISLQLIRQT